MGSVRTPVILLIQRSTQSMYVDPDPSATAQILEARSAAFEVQNIGAQTYCRVVQAGDQKAARCVLVPEHQVSRMHQTLDYKLPEFVESRIEAPSKEN